MIDPRKIDGAVLARLMKETEKPADKMNLSMVKFGLNPLLLKAETSKRGYLHRHLPATSNDFACGDSGYIPLALQFLLLEQPYVRGWSYTKATDGFTLYLTGTWIAVSVFCAPTLLHAYLLALQRMHDAYCWGRKLWRACRKS